MAKYVTPKELYGNCYGENYKATIIFYPHSKWEVVRETHDLIQLYRKHVQVQISREEYEEQWEEVEE
jgi:hypothetical protein